MASKEILEAAKTASAGFPSCPRATGIRKYHMPDACATKPTRPPEGDVSRRSIYQKLLTGGTGASSVPDEETRFCPLYETDSLESPTAIKGFDTTWIVENTSSQATVISWVVDGVEVSPFEPGLSPMDDPKCLLRPGGEINNLQFLRTSLEWNVVYFIRMNLRLILFFFYRCSIFRLDFCPNIRILCVPCPRG